MRTAAPLFFLLAAGCASLSETRWTRENPFRVEVSAANFQWAFRYPGGAGEMKSAKDVCTHGEVVLPAHSHVELLLHSADFVYVFFMPRLKQREMAVPGLTFTLAFQTGAPGTSEFVCDDVCGLTRTNLAGKVTVEAVRDLERDLKAAKKCDDSRP